ncbi:hypothetical protein ASC95_22895 [Pelomonas sp. Root1217]|uniref:hypothetical protein n=1 Tax=Pelomonas sp. Root1217 TaxID=1736430 RepID=UPI00070C6528|nr:hypothetical protein [Pelomonas sp. Root1217]KQV48744.1 hypothetical protein ASC95_22895 [Pelomonas sp. Root1217]
MKPKDQDRLLIVAICLISLAGLAYGGIAMLAFLASKGTTFKEFDGPAWTQAVGSVGAILVAVWVFQRQAQHAESSSRRQDAAGVRLRGDLLRSMSKLGYEVDELVFAKCIDPVMARSVDKINWSRVREIEVVLLEARNGMNSFQPAQMTCGAELILWNLAKARAAALCDEVALLKGNVFSRREQLQSAAFMLKFQANDCESMAVWVEAGDRDALQRFRHGHI